MTSLIEPEVLAPVICSPTLVAASQPEQRAKPDRLRLGPVGRCPRIPTLTIAISDDSGSVVSPGGTDPLSARYAEIGLAFRAIARACTCRHERAAVIHFDTPHGDVGPVRLNRAGLARLRVALRTPMGGYGTSELRPALATARTLAEAHADHQIVVVIFSDFELFDDPGELVDDLDAFPGTVHGVVLGKADPEPLAGIDQLVGITHDSPRGSVAQALLGGLTTHRRPGRWGGL